jgi:hypothetical protein
MKSLIPILLIITSFAYGENLELHEKRFSSELIKAKEAEELSRVIGLFYLLDLPSAHKKIQFEIAQEILDRPIEKITFIESTYFEKHTHWNLPIRSAIKIDFSDRILTGQYAHTLGYTLPLGIYDGKMKIIESTTEDDDTPSITLELPPHIKKTETQPVE